ncbi:Gfo/Idh/MocA family protein [Nitrosovibrio tenuis]|uniref:Predicted dehydrogenase n=1 Tax=Nitrosovibrio tenuis TaxID=1233 RepID=A0A1H7GJN3_9PROT|nr:Gfo/Idh/MocA family oxidoreductase [Nitrosovibrio tenuis]SEK36065.1 Predicted dehydrogenase [Nitrosovibrio tenuis]
MSQCHPYQLDSSTSHSRKLRVAFLGGAYESAVGRVHRIAVEMDQKFELVAGCFSRNLETNRKSALRYGVVPARTYSDLDELLGCESSQIDGILIPTPTNQHKLQVMRCLAAGIPVICEKALVTSSEEAADIKALLSQRGGFLAVTYNYTGYPMIRELKHMIEQGRFGKIQQIHIEMPQEGFSRISDNGVPIAPQDWRLHDGQIPTISLDLGVHLHMMVRFLTNEHPTEIVAISDTYGNFPQIIDNVSCIARYTNNLNCSIWYSKTALGHRNGLKLRLFGESGSAEWLQENPEYLQFADNHGRRIIMDRASSEVQVSNQTRYTRFKAGHPSGFIEAFANYYYDAADTLGMYLDKNEPCPSPYVFGIDETLEGIHMLEAIVDSSINKCWVNVK